MRIYIYIGIPYNYITFKRLIYLIIKYSIYNIIYYTPIVNFLHTLFKNMNTLNTIEF